MKPARAFTIGRDPRCDIAVADDSVSRIHAELLCGEDGSMVVRDRGSSNGTRLIRKGNSKPVVQEAVYASDTLQFGGVAIPVAEILMGLQGKLSNHAAVSENRQPAAAGKEIKLERCACGTIKPVHKPCPECHQ